MKGNGLFIITPYGKEYEVERNGVLVSSSVEDASFTNRVGVVKYLPINYKGSIAIGDFVVVGHNMFRTYYDMKGRKTKSSAYFKDSMYIADGNDIYLYKKNGDVNWESESDFCAVKPVENNSKWSNEQYKYVTGIITVTNEDLKKQNVNINDNVVFKSGGEYEFYIDGVKWYIMRSKNIFIVE
jgi:hypothetical protein